MTIDDLTPEQIRAPEVYQKIKDLGDSFVRCVQAKEAWFLKDRLASLMSTSNLRNFNPELQKNYDILIISLKWTAFPMLLEEEALLLLRSAYISVLDNENIDVQERIEAKMFTFGLFPRNELRQKMHKALNENKEDLGNKTFGEWLIDYSRTFDFRERDEITPVKYVSQNSEAQQLPEPEKNKLRKGFQIFDKTLLVTPVMSEPLFSMTVMALINNGEIDKRTIDPILLQTISITAKTAMGTTVIPSTPPTHPLPKIEPIKTELRREVPREPIPGFKKEIKTFPLEIEKILEEEPKEEPKEEPQPRRVGGYQIRTMEQDIKKAGKQPIPPKPQPKIKDNIVDLSGK